MAAPKDVNSIDDFVNCDVCWCEYDANCRKPKFLPCSHTVCILCLREIYRDGSFTCPTCCQTFGQEPDSLSTNEYALQLLVFKKCKNQRVMDSSLSDNGRELRWCTECESLATSSCTSSQHSTFIMTTTTVKHLDDFFHLKKDFQLKKDEQLNKLSIAVGMRKNIDEDLSLFKELATTVKREIEKLRDENNIHLKELKNLNDSLDKGDFLPELANFVKYSTSGDTIDTLILNLNKCRELCENKLQETFKSVSELKFCSETKIAIHLYDQDNRPIPTFDSFEEGFRILGSLTKGRHRSSKATNRNQQDFKLISHLIYSIMEKVNSSVDQFTPQGIAETSAVSLAMETIPAPSFSLPPEMPVLPNFLLGQSVFYLWLLQSNKPIGAICIRPVPTFNPAFVQKLGDYCFHSPMTFSNKISKATSGNYIFLPVIQPELKQLFEGMKHSARSHQDGSDRATQINDVGINFVTTLKNRNIVGWSFIFILENSSPSTKKMMPTSDLFGRFHNYHLLETIQKKSSIAAAGEENNYSLSLESR